MVTKRVYLPGYDLASHPFMEKMYANPIRKINTPEFARYCEKEKAKERKKDNHYRMMFLQSPLACSVLSSCVVFSCQLL